MIKEFKKFAFKGNVVDMAVGLVIGGAFGTIVSSLVSDIIMPVFGFITAGIDLKDLKFVLREAVMENGVVTTPEIAVTYGSFIQNVINFLIISFSIFLVIRSINKLKSMKEKAPEPETAPKPTSEELLCEIRDILKDQNKEEC